METVAGVDSRGGSRGGPGGDFLLPRSWCFKRSWRSSRKRRQWCRRCQGGAAKVVIEPHRHAGVFVARGREDFAGN